jgi:hypothetical protein
MYKAGKNSKKNSYEIFLNGPSKNKGSASKASNASSTLTKRKSNVRDSEEKNTEFGNLSCC